MSSSSTNCAQGRRIECLPSRAAIPRTSQALVGPPMPRIVVFFILLRVKPNAAAIPSGMTVVSAPVSMRNNVCGSRYSPH